MATLPVATKPSALPSVENPIKQTSLTEGEAVKLHGKCQSCQRLLRSLILPDLAFPPFCDNTKPEKWHPVFMCTLRYLLQSYKECHVCNMVFAAMQKEPRNKFVERFRDANVYVQARAWSGGLTVTVRLAGHFDDDVERCGFVGPFKLGTYQVADVDDPFKQHITAKQVPRLSRDNIGRAKGWIETCVAGHGRCRAFQENTVESRQRPSRVLEVTATSVRLRCDMSHEIFDYLVLSHMWGEDHEKQIQLLDSNLDAFKTDIPWPQLCASAVYKEAIRITCTLGYRFLWIDSLCIIQKSASDWQHEASRMSLVYGNATANISTLFSPPTRDEISRTDPRAWNPCILRAATPTRPGLYLERRFPAADPPPWLLQSKWPLFTRAWTFQEYLLSPRTLLVGHTNLMCQCSQLFYDELLGPLGDGNGMLVNEEKSSKASGTDFGKTKYFSAALTRVRSAGSVMDVAVLLFAEDWLKVFNEYRARELSYASNRIIAFAGVARAFAYLGGLTYLAGAWGECMPLCLLWYLDRKATDTAMQDNDLPHAGDMTFEAVVREAAHDPGAVPGWSWFSVAVYRYHDLHYLLCTDELSLRRKSNLRPPTVHFTDLYFAKLQSYGFPKHAEDVFPRSGFSDFRGLKLSLSVRLFPVKDNVASYLSSYLDFIQHTTPHPQDCDFDCDPVFTYHHDDLLTPRRNPSRKGVLALVAEYQIVRLGGKYNIQRILAGLVLVEGEEEGTWRRTGVWKLKVRIWGVDVSAENLRIVGERWEAYGEIGEEWEEGIVVLM